MENNKSEDNNNVISFPAGELANSEGVRVRALNDGENKRIDGYVELLWAKVNEFMGSGSFVSQADFDFKMSTWVQALAIENSSDRELVLQAGNETQRRFLVVMKAVLDASNTTPGAEPKSDALAPLPFPPNTEDYHEARNERS